MCIRRTAELPYNIIITYFILISQDKSSISAKISNFLIEYRFDGLSPSGKAQDFDSCIRQFESA